MKLLSSSSIPLEFHFNKTVVALTEVEEVVLHTEKVIYIKNYDALYRDVHGAQEGVSSSHLSLSGFISNRFVCSNRENNKTKIKPTLFTHIRKIL